jgi:acyl-CoA thioesterase
MTAKEFFQDDIFAKEAGVELVEVRTGYAKAQLRISKQHLNAGGRTQGGALFTLADLALAACSNSHGRLSFSLSADITFVRASGEGDVLTAVAEEKYLGRTTAYYEVSITSQEGKLIASFHSSVFRMDAEVPFTV